MDTTQSDRTLEQLKAMYLHPSGWCRSCDEGRAVTADGDPLPWVTYPAQRMLAQLVRPEWRVFEYGAGLSSLWWAARVRRVASVDHDEAWVGEMRERGLPNLEVHHRPRGIAGTLPAEMAIVFDEIAAAQPLSGRQEHDIAHGLTCDGFAAYAGTLTEYSRHRFDVVVVDGMARAPCCYIAGEWVRPGGIVVVDNSERWQYRAGLDALRDLGFGRIDFYGMSPALGYESCTSIFVRSMEPLLAMPPRTAGPADINWDHW